MEQVVKTKTPSNAKYWMKAHATNFAAYGGLVFCIIFFTILTPLRGQSIWSPAKLQTLLSDVIVTSLITVGAVFPYSLGSMDVSIGRQVGLYATIMVFMGNLTGSLIPGILICLVISVVIGAVNGAAGELLHIFPISPSVVFMLILQGVITLIYANLGTRSIVLRTIPYAVFKSPMVMLVVLVVEVLVVTYLMNYTKFGKYAKAIGANQVATSQSGVNIIKYRVAAYLIMGVCVVLGALFQMGYTGSASDGTAVGYEMNVMVALILGGMTLGGGMRSRVSCAVVGSLTFSLLDVGLPLIGVPTRMTFLIKAVIFLVVVLITCRKKDGPLP